MFFFVTYRCLRNVVLSCYQNLPNHILPKNCLYYVGFNSTCYQPPPGTPPGICNFFFYLAVYSPPPGTQKETIPHPRDSSSTTNTLFCVQNRFPYNSTTRRFDKNLNAFVEFTERRILHSVKKHGHCIEKETEEKSLTALAFGWQVKKCSSPRVLF